MSEAISQSPTLVELRAKRDTILRVAAAHGAANVRVFGSIARGDADTASDVDFIVDIPDDIGGFRAFGLLEDLRRDFETIIGRRVDVITLIGPFSREGGDMAHCVEREAVQL